jgi:hypothetical protein
MMLKAKGIRHKSKVRNALSLVNFNVEKAKRAPVSMFRTCAFCLVPFALAGVFVSACGYALSGRGAFLPDYIKTIGVPQCVNQTSVPDLDRILTEQVRTEFASHGRYKASPESTGVDALVTCTIKTSTLTPSAFTDNIASRYAVVITAGIEFKDIKTDKVLWANPSVQVREEYPVTTALTAGDPSAFFGQDQNALQRLAQDFARSIVSSILEAF